MKTACGGQGISNGLQGTSFQGARRGGSRSSVELQQLLRNQVLVSVSVGDATWDSVVIAEGIVGPELKGLTVHAELRDKTGSFAYRIVLQTKMFDGQWQPTTLDQNDELLAEQTANNYVIGNEFTTATKLGLNCRLVVQYHSKTGGTAGDRGELSVVLAKAYRWG